jgi:hypothetical protein
MTPPQPLDYGRERLDGRTLRIAVTGGKNESDTLTRTREPAERWRWNGLMACQSRATTIIYSP